MRGRFLPVLGLVLASFVQCVGADPGATGEGDGDKDSGTSTTDSGGGGPTDTGGGGNDGNTGGDADMDADAGKGPLAWSPLHWAATSPFGPIGSVAGVDASCD